MDTSAITDLLDSDFDGISISSDPWSPAPIPSSPTLPAVHTDPANPWDPRMILDLAIGVDGLVEILDRYGLTQQEYELLTSSRTFRRDLAMTMRDVRENGVPFVKKSSVLAESYLDEIHEMVTNQATPASVKLSAIQSVVKWGRLEPQNEKNDGPGTGHAINIQINF